MQNIVIALAGSSWLGSSNKNMKYYIIDIATILPMEIVCFKILHAALC